MVGDEIILNNTIQFSNGGNCGVRQKIDILLRRSDNGTEVCNTGGCVRDGFEVVNDSSIRIAKAASEDNGTYILITQLTCPGDTLLTHTFNLIIKGKPTDLMLTNDVYLLSTICVLLEIPSISPTGMHMYNICTYVYIIILM